MADSQYVSAAGFVQFEPNAREANGKEVTEVVIKTLGGDAKQIRVTIWPETRLERPVEKGDFIAVDGKFTTNTYQSQDGSPKTSLQISAGDIAILGTAAPREDSRPVVKKAGKGEGKSLF